MKRSWIAGLLCLLASCARPGAPVSIVPQPAGMELQRGSMKLAGASFHCDSALGEDALRAAERFAAQLEAVSGRHSRVAAGTQFTGRGRGLSLQFDGGLGPEAYTLLVKPGRAVVRAGGFNGVLYALETLRQLLPAAIYGSERAAGERWTVPCCEIRDEPRFAWRGMHLDCARHFWSVDEIKRYLDVMAMYKLNRFHWHLTDDQGWRIEIKSYPLLSEVASWREGTMVGRDFSSSDHIRYGGFYSQDEIREVVAYAAERGIEVMPEIELPGHMVAAMSAYPQLGCTGGPYTPWIRWGISDEVLCVGKESTFHFLEAVLGEVAELFPGEYIHIGGDECPKMEWKKCPFCQARIRQLGLHDDERFTAEQYLQNYVTKRIQDFLATKGKKVVGWDEILEGELAPGATVMSWRGTAGAREASAKGFDTILSPTSHCYFDYRQADADEEPLGPRSVVTLEKIYSFDPLEGMSPQQTPHVLGLQANLWTEYIATPEHLEYMLLPRMIALAEVQWCADGRRDFDRFVRALETHEFPALDRAGYHYRESLPIQ